MAVLDLHGLIENDGFPKVADDDSSLVIHQQIVQFQIPVYYLERGNHCTTNTLETNEKTSVYWAHVMAGSKRIRQCIHIRKVNASESE